MKNELKRNQLCARISLIPKLIIYIKLENRFEPGKLFKTIFKQYFRKNFIETLKILAESSDPLKEFYRGNLTKKMVEEFQNNSKFIIKNRI